MIDYKRISVEAIEEFISAWKPADSVDSMGNLLVHELRNEMLRRRHIQDDSLNDTIAKLNSANYAIKLAIAAISPENAKRDERDDDVLYL